MSNVRTISISKGAGFRRHNRRDFSSVNVDDSRTHLNKVYVDQSLSEAYEILFGNAIREYDLKQKRASRRYGSTAAYLKRVQASGNGEHDMHEIVAQVGDMHDCACGTPDGDRAAEILDQYAREWQSRNPRLYLVGMYLHLDEATPHLHIDFIPFADGYKTGPAVRNSMDRALKLQGVDPREDNRRSNVLIVWQDQERNALERIMNEHGWIRAERSGSDRKGLPIDQYRATMEALTDALSQVPMPSVQMGIGGKPKISAKEWEDVQERLRLADTLCRAADQALREVQDERKQLAAERADLRDKMRVVPDLEIQIGSMEAEIAEARQQIEELRMSNTALRAEVKRLTPTPVQQQQRPVRPQRPQVPQRRRNEPQERRRQSGWER